MHSSELLSASKFIIIWDSSPSLAFPMASISVAVQGTANALLHETWIKYEEMFNCLDEVKRAFNAMEPGQLGFEKFKRQSRRCGPSFTIITPTPNVHSLSLI